MKYVMTWTTRSGGSGTENEAATRRALDLLSKWQPEQGTTIHQFVARVDSEGGFAVIETENVGQVLNATTKFAPYIQYQVYPVVDITEAVQAIQEGIGYRNGIG